MLSHRFKEREENVKGDIFAAYIVLARQVGSVAKRYRPEDSQRCMLLRNFKEY